MTRTLKISAIAIMGALVLWACGGGASSSKEVGEKFLKALATGDYGTAKEYATKESQESLEMLEKMGGGETGGSADDIVVGESKEEGDKATLSYTEKGVEKTLDLVKEDGAWKAKFSKGGPTEGNGGMIEEIGESIEDAVNEIADDVEEVVEEDHNEDEH